MRSVLELSGTQAKHHFLKGSSYFNADLPWYLGFDAILKDVEGIVSGKNWRDFTSSDPAHLPDVNYRFIANKDGRLAWRPFELIHPVLYVALVDLICDDANWSMMVDRFKAFQTGAIDCHSIPKVSSDQQSDRATQVRHWWQRIEQDSIEKSLEFSHLLHTDVTNCYGSLYTHSIAWALHGVDEAKAQRTSRALLGNKIDCLIRAGRYGQTNGISQGSVLMDFVAELVLGYVDEQITARLKNTDGFRILRYRDDYRIFADSDRRAEDVLKAVSDELRAVGMALAHGKTALDTNVVESSVKADKRAGIDLQDLGDANAKTIQKRLLRIHAFSLRYPNSGALRRLVAEMHDIGLQQEDKPDDVKVQVAIATDIAFVSPQAFPGIAGVLSHLISLAPEAEKRVLWEAVIAKMRRVPYNGYLEVWLQRLTAAKELDVQLCSDEPICKIANGQKATLWNSDWISDSALVDAINTLKIRTGSVSEVNERVEPSEVELFKQDAWAY